MVTRLHTALIISAVICLAGCSSSPLKQVSVTSQTPLESIGEGFKETHRVVGRTDERVQAAWRRQLHDFTSDDSYACRRPLYARYFNQYQSFTPYNDGCSEEIPFHLTNGLEADEIIWLNPDKVHAVHLLFIGRGDAMMSRFGHTAFRLITCPDGDTSAEACNGNLYEHLVLGYMARLDGFSINPIRGLRGDYDANLFAGKFMDAYERYAIGEFREIYSIPLKMSEEDKAFFIRALSEVHWGSSGKYRFLTNNCSTLAQRLLILAWRDGRESTHNISRIRWRPDRFFRDITKTDLVNSAVLENKVQAEREGYYFPGTRPAYEAALSLVKASMAGAEFGSLDDYTSKHPRERMVAILEDRGYYQLLHESPRLLTAQIMLEELAFLRMEKIFLAEMAGYFERHGVDSIGEAARQALNKEDWQRFEQCVLQPIKRLTTPFRYYNGIPDQYSVPAVGKECSEEDTRSAIAMARFALPEGASGWQRIEAVSTAWQLSLENIISLSNMEKTAAPI